MQKESGFQSDLINDLENLFPGCVVLKNDPNYLQGIPDLLILYKDRWAVLESKRGLRSSRRVNQDYYIDKFGKMSFAAFICPDNKQEVLHDLQLAFRSRRKTRVSQP